MSRMRQQMPAHMARPGRIAGPASVRGSSSSGASFSGTHASHNFASTSGRDGSRFHRGSLQVRSGGSSFRPCHTLWLPMLQAACMV